MLVPICMNCLHSKSPACHSKLDKPPWGAVDKRIERCRGDGEGNAFIANQREGVQISSQIFLWILYYGVGVRFWSCVNKGYFNGLVGWGGRWLFLKRLVKWKQNILFSILSFFLPFRGEKSFKMETCFENEKSTWNIWSAVNAFLLSPFHATLLGKK